MLDDDTAEMIAIHAWSKGDPAKIPLWGTIHAESRANHIAFVRVVARQLIALGWQPPAPQPEE